MRYLLKPPQEHGLGRLEPVGRERDARIRERGRVPRQPFVVRIRRIAFRSLAGGKQLRCEVPPAIRDSCIECHGTTQRRQRFARAATRCIRATQLELQERRVRPRPGERFEHRGRGCRITELAVGRGQEQMRLWVAR